MMKAIKRIISFRVRLLKIILFVLISTVIYGQNIVVNGNFESGLAQWTNWSNSGLGYSASFSSSTVTKHSGNKSAKIQINQIGNYPDPYRITFKTNQFGVKSGHSYQATVWMKSTNQNASAKLVFRKNTSPYTVYASQLIQLSTTWTMYNMVWDGNTISTNGGTRFAIEVGSHTGDIYVDDVIITNCIRPNGYVPLQSSIVGKGRIQMQTSMGLTECLSLGQNSFPMGVNLSLVASPEQGYTFQGWGGVCSGTGPCNVSMDSASYVNAYFAKTGNTIVDIDYKNRVDWSIAGYEGVIPYITSNIIDMTGAPYHCIGNGSLNNYTKLQTALSDAASSSGWTVLFFPPGTYKVKGSTPLSLPDSTIIRGDCPQTTKINLDFDGLNDDSKGCFEMKTTTKGIETRVLSGMHLNSRQMAVNSTSNFSIGDFVEIRQDNDQSVMHAPNNYGDRAVGEIARITGVTAYKITLDRGLHYTYNPHFVAKIRTVDVVRNAGIENLKIERIDEDKSWNVCMIQTYNCWLRNVESKYTYKGHVRMNSTYHCEIRDSYFHMSHKYGSGGRGYGAEMVNRSTLNLVENNIFYKLRHAMLIHIGCNANVFGYNYSDKNTDIGPGLGSKKANISLHGYYPFMNLFEGNEIQYIYSGDHNGASGIGNTFFRNRTHSTINAGTRGGILVKQYSHKHNIIANEVTNWTVLSGTNAKITIGSNCKYTNQHSNYIRNGGSSYIDENKTSTLAKSLYKTTPNSTYGYPMPSIGPSIPYKSHNIEAHDRFNSGDYVSCLENCGPITDTVINMTSCNNSLNIQLPNYSSKHVLHAVKIKGYSNSTGPWYEFEGSPEMYVKVKNGSTNFFTSNQSMSETGNPPKYINTNFVELNPSSTYNVEIWDYDWSSGDEYLGNVTFSGNTTALDHQNGSNKIRLNKTIYSPLYSWSNGSTASSLTVNQSGIYTATVTTPDGCEALYQYNVILNRDPLFILHPKDQYACKDATTMPMSISANGGFGLVYQWFSNSQNSYVGGVPIPNANSTTYYPPTNVVGAFYYWCVVTDVTNSNCGSDTSIIANQMVFEAPNIVQQGVLYQVLCQHGSPASLNVSATSNLYNLQYRWYQTTDTLNTTNGVLIPGANSNSFIPPSDSIGVFYYYCLISSSFSVTGCFATTSDVFTVEVIDQPSLINQYPASQNICQNGPLNPLTVNVSGSGNIIDYQWYINQIDTNIGGSILSGANNYQYMPYNYLGESYYYCEINVNVSGCYDITSQSLSVSVNENPIIFDMINSHQVICQGDTILPLTVIGNSGSFANQWYFSQANSYSGSSILLSAVNTTYVPTWTLSVGNHYFYCVKSDTSGNGCDSDTSRIFEVIVIDSIHVDFGYVRYGGLIHFYDSSNYASTWHWDFGDGVTSNQKNPMHFYANDGTYNVTLIASNPCGVDTVIKTIRASSRVPDVKGWSNKMREEVIETDEGFNSSDVNCFEIYPNPATNFGNLEITVIHSGNVNVQLCNSMGQSIKEILNQYIKEGKYRFHMSLNNLPRGVYYVNMYTLDEIISKRLIVL